MNGNAPPLKIIATTAHARNIIHGYLQRGLAEDEALIQAYASITELDQKEGTAHLVPIVAEAITNETINGRPLQVTAQPEDSTLRTSPRFQLLCKDFGGGNALTFERNPAKPDQLFILNAKKEKNHESLDISGQSTDPLGQLVANWLPKSRNEGNISRVLRQQSAGIKDLTPRNQAIVALSAHASAKAAIQGGHLKDQYAIMSVLRGQIYPIKDLAPENQVTVAQSAHATAQAAFQGGHLKDQGAIGQVLRGQSASIKDLAAENQATVALSAHATAKAAIQGEHLERREITNVLRAQIASIEHLAPENQELVALSAHATAQAAIQGGHLDQPTLMDVLHQQIASIKDLAPQNQAPVAQNVSATVRAAIQGRKIVRQTMIGEVLRAQIASIKGLAPENQAAVAQNVSATVRAAIEGGQLNEQNLIAQVLHDEYIVEQTVIPKMPAGDERSQAIRNLAWTLGHMREGDRTGDNFATVIALVDGMAHGDDREQACKELESPALEQARKEWTDSLPPAKRAARAGKLLMNALSVLSPDQKSKRTDLKRHYAVPGNNQRDQGR